MKVSHIAAVACLMTVGIDFPAAAFTPQVCRQPVEGYDTFTDCYGMELTGAALRAAQAREMASMNKTPGDITKALGGYMMIVRAAQPTCPRGSTFVGSEQSLDGQSYLVHCVS